MEIWGIKIVNGLKLKEKLQNEWNVWKKLAYWMKNYTIDEKFEK
jgi:hypothetical protein